MVRIVSRCHAILARMALRANWSRLLLRLDHPVIVPTIGFRLIRRGAGRGQQAVASSTSSTCTTSSVVSCSGLHLSLIHI